MKILAISMVLVTGLLFWRCSSKKEQVIIIISPGDTQVLPTQNQVRILAKTDPPIDVKYPVNATITYVHKGEENIIAQGDIRSFSDPDKLQAFWDISGLAEGEYQLKVSMEGVHAAVNVKVHQAPAVDMELVSVMHRSEGSEVKIKAVVEHSESVPIDKFLWTAGDGNSVEETHTPVFTHTYTEADTFLVWLEVQDTLGGVTLITRDLILPASKKEDGQLIATTDCGCTAMTIVAGGGRSGTYCVPTVVINGQRVVNPAAVAQLASQGCNALGAPGAGGCPLNMVPVDCPLGQVVPAANQPNLQYGFEVRADLAANTNDISQCPEGQYVRGDLSLNGFALPNPATNIPPPPGPQNLPGGTGGAAGFNFRGVQPRAAIPPFAGPNYGSDDFARPEVFKLHTPRQIRWYDPPGIQVPGGTNAANRSAEFITFVKGTPTCWCRFRLIQNWTRAAGLAAGNRIQIIDGNLCAAGAGVEDARNP